MFESFLGILRKRRRVDGEPETTTTPQSQSQSPSPHPSSMLSDDECPYAMQINDSDSDLLVLSRRQLATIDRGGAANPYSPRKLRQRNKQQGGNSNNNNQQAFVLHSENLQRIPEHTEAMEIDSAPVPPPQEYSDSPFQQQHSESSMNFDYLSSLHSSPSAGTYGMDTSSPAGVSSFRKGSDSGSYAYVDDRAVDRPFNLNERFVGVLDQLDARVEKFRKDALGLQEKRDFLLMSIDLIKTNDLLQAMSESEREEVSCYIQRVNSRLSTVELNVRTVRDTSQEDSLSQINMLIDMMITLGDPVLSRQRCQQYLNACSSSDGSSMGSFASHVLGQDVIVDKKFECALLGCTLDDQKNIKKRLQALMGYLNKQTIRD